MPKIFLHEQCSHIPDYKENRTTHDEDDFQVLHDENDFHRSFQVLHDENDFQVFFPGSPWADKITLAILDYHESGLMEDLDNKWILRSKWWSRSPNLLIITSSAISLFLAGRRTRIAKTRTGTTRSPWAWRTCGGWAPLSSPSTSWSSVSSCSLSSSSSGVHPGRPWDSWRSWPHRRRDSLSQTQGDHHRDHHHHHHHRCGDHHLAYQVRRERRAEAAKDAINRWKGTIEVA